MSAHQIVLCGVLIALAGCSGDERSATVLAGAEPSSVPARTEELFLRTLPNACDYLPESLAHELLQSEVARRAGAARRPTVTDECSYSGPGGSGKHIGFRDNSTTLVSLTGIGGTAVTSDRIVSELSISYFLSDPEQTYESRLGHIVALAKNHLERMRRLAGATDRYGPTS